MNPCCVNHPFKMYFIYRVHHPSGHPQISLCASIQKKKTVLNWPPPEMTNPGLATTKKWQSPQLLSKGVASSGLCHFWVPRLGHHFCSLNG